MKINIPLSYTRIDSARLTTLLKSYEDKEHTSIVNDFESAIARQAGVPFALCVQSGTAALHLALLLANVGPGDLVLVSTFTYIASVTPVLYVGATPVFIDCEPLAWNMDPTLLEEAISDLGRKGKKVKCIILVHNYGNPCEIKSIFSIANRSGIPVIEDAAEALGSQSEGGQVGATGMSGIFSFNNNKINSTYGGGAVLLRDQATYQRARFLATHAREDLPYYEHKEQGFNYRMSALNAAYGLSQWDSLAANVNARQRVFEKYRSALAGLPGFGCQIELAGAVSNRWLSAFTFTKELKVKIATILQGEGIETRPLWNPIHRQPLFRNSQSFDKGISDNFFDRGICLPSSGDLSPGQQDRIIEIILRAAS